MPGPVDELIRWATLAAGPTGVADRDLLERFVAGRDQAAFAELVRRHGPVVFGVCRRVVGHRQDAEDAFQATFLVLARKADRVGRPDALGGWLYAVAVRVARKARRVADRRRNRETPVHPLPDAPVLAVERCSELAGVIDEELAALPAWYRDAVVLCDLRGQSRTEAAGALGIPEGTLSSRLNAGRKKLAVRLARRGVEVPAAGLAATLGTDVIAVAPRLVASAADAALAGSAGGAVAAKIQFLAAEWGWGVGKVKLLAAAVVATGVGVGTVAGWSGEKPGDEPAKPATPPVPKVEPVAKAEVPAEKPPVLTRPKLVRSAEVAGAVREAPVWNHDGRYFVLGQANGIAIFDVETLKCEVLSDPQAKTTKLLGVAKSKSGSLIATHETGRGSINAHHQVHFYEFTGDISRMTEFQKPLDPADGTPVELLADGRTVLATENVKGRPRPSRPVRGSGGRPSGPDDDPGETIYRRIDAMTGAADSQVVRVAGPVVGMCPTPSGDGVIVASVSAEGMTVRRHPFAGGKPSWERMFKGAVQEQYGPNAVVASPDGVILAVAVSRRSPSSGWSPGPDGMSGGVPSGETVNEVVIIDGATGEERRRLDSPDEGRITGYGLSGDGRLIVGRFNSGRNEGRRYEIERIVIWDTRTGKVLKSWDGSATASFSPTQPVLAVVERVTLSTTRAANGAVQTERFGSVVGLWDVSSLLK